MYISLDMPNMAWDIATQYIIDDRVMTIGIQLKNIIRSKDSKDKTSVTSVPFLL